MRDLKIFKNQLRLLFNYTKNPVSTLLFYMGLKNKLNCNLKEYGKVLFKEETRDNLGRTLFTIDQLERYNLNDKAEEFKNFIQTFDDDIFYINGINFYNNDYRGVLWEYFSDNPFIDDNFENRVIIDVGSNIGDTPLFMANKGATVYAFEPVPETYEMSLKNIDLNPNLKSKINVYNKAISGKHEYIKIYTDTKENSPGANSFIETDNFVEIEAFTLKQVINKFKITPDILKLDCEGAEYSIIKNSDLKCFNLILLEYHEKFVGESYNILVDKLVEDGFDVDIKKIDPYNLNEFGFIIATNKNEHIN